ncbi:DUF192 domain-containing protein [Halorubrum pallidum]
MRRRALEIAATASAVTLLVAVAVAVDPTLLIAGYETTTVEAVDGESNASLASVEARVADGFVKQYVGLSAAADLPADRGMLFVHGDTAERAYVMRDMAFGLDIVFADADGTVTAIHEAEPETRPFTRYRGTGRYVLEVPRGWSDRHGVEAGDRLVFDVE